MLKDFEAVLGFAKRALSAEMKSDAGRVNLAAGSLTDLLQALVRIARPEYESGLPSVALLLLMFLVAALVCVCIVGYFTARENSE